MKTPTTRAEARHLLSVAETKAARARGMAKSLRGHWFTAIMAEHWDKVAVEEEAKCAELRAFLAAPPAVSP